MKVNFYKLIFKKFIIFYEEKFNLNELGHFNKMLERDLIEFEDNYRVIFENINDLIALISMDLEIEYVNEKVHLKLLGYSSDNLIGRNIKEILKKDDYDGFFEELKEILESKGKITSEIQYLHKKGHYIWFETKFKVFLTKNGIKKILLVSRNVENLINKRVKKLKELDQIRKDLISRVSHELKTPLMTISGSTELLIDMFSHQLGEEALELLKMIEKGSMRLKYLVENLLDVSRIEYNKFVLEKENSDLSELIRECSKDIMHLKEKREIQLQLQLPESLYLNIDVPRVEQIITNLLSNALKNTPPKGIITITLKKIRNWAEMVVNDTGVGLTENEMKLLFTRFGKIERYISGLEYLDIQGSGLGLYISKQIVDLHKGKIRVESPGRHKGSTFTVLLPLNKTSKPSI